MAELTTDTKTLADTTTAPTAITTAPTSITTAPAETAPVDLSRQPTSFVQTQAEEMPAQPISQPVIPAADVYTADTIRKTAEAVPYPDLATDNSDLTKIRQNIYASLGINEKQSAFNEAYQSYYEQLQGARDRQQTIEGKTVGTTVIQGRQAEMAKIDSLRTQALAEGMNVLQSSLNAALQEANTLYGIQAGEYEYNRNLQIQYPGANIQAGDSTEEIAKKIEKYQDDKAEEEAFFQTYGVRLSDRPKGMSKKEYKKRIEKKAKNKQEKEDAFNEQMNSLKLEEMKLSISKARQSLAGGGSSRDTEFEKALKEQANAVLSGNYSRETAKAQLKAFFPDYDENAIYSVVPDNAI